MGTDDYVASSICRSEPALVADRGPEFILKPGVSTFTVRYFIQGPPVIWFSGPDGPSDRPRPIEIPVLRDLE